MLASQQQQQQLQQQQQQQLLQPIISARTTASINKTSSYNYTANTKDLNDNDENGEDSFDNSTSLCLHNLSRVADAASANNNNSQYVNYNMENTNNSNTNTNTRPASNQNTIGLIQTWLDKRTIEKALQTMQSIQQQLERMTVTGNGRLFIKREMRVSSSGTHGLTSADNDVDVNGDAIGDIADEHSNSSTVGDPNDDTSMDYGEILNEERDFIMNETIFFNELLSHEYVDFNLQTPTLVSSYFNVHYVCETGSRIIFLTTFWLRKINAFCELPQHCQVTLLRQSWPSLIAIAIAQVDSLSQATIIKTLINNTRQLTETIDKIIDPQKIIKLSEHIARLNSFIQYVHSLNPSNMEYAYLRLVCVFNPHVFLKRKEQQIRIYVQRVQQYALTSLRRMLLTTRVSTTASSTTSDADERFNALILNIMPLSALESETIEELFFVKLLGKVQINNILPYIMALSANMANLQ